ncbi:MAG: helix-turn-helix domain-containing protein [Bacteroidales bacterium]
MGGKQLKTIDIQTVKQLTAAETITNDFAIFNDINNVPLFDYPNRIDCVMFALCITGSLEVGINLEKHELRKQQLGVMRPDQIMQLFRVSEDFTGRFIVLSRRFLEEAQIDFKNALSIFLYFKDNPITDLTDMEMEIMLEYHAMLHRKVKLEDVEYRRKIAQHLLHALFYEVNMFFSCHHAIENPLKTRKEELFERFMKEVATNYKQHRSVAFYAEKLCLTPKYLSSAVKEASGKLAGQWIDECVILEAKTLLKSSGRSIQQIAEDLNFANQSFFGKYFKQHTGMSPSQYKTKYQRAYTKMK